MGNTKADERRYIGRFTILQEEMDVEIIYNKKSGCIFLDLAKPLDEHTFIGKSYANIAVITGYINTGAVVTLFNNKCINNHTLRKPRKSGKFQSDVFKFYAEMKE